MNTQEIYKHWMSLQPITLEQKSLMCNKFTLDYNYNSNHIKGSYPLARLRFSVRLLAKFVK